MFKKFILVIAAVLICPGAFSQKKEPVPHGHWGLINNGQRQEPVIHKYLTIMAWDVVRAEHPEVIGTEMDLAMRNPITGVYGDWWGSEYDETCTGSIVSGAFREDSEDIIWGENNTVIPFTNEKPFVSVTHFWLADLGDDHEPIFWGEHRKNAIQKVRALWQGGHYVSCASWPRINLTGLSTQICVEHNPPEIYRFKETLHPGAKYSIREVFINPFDNLETKEISLKLVIGQGQGLPRECTDFFYNPDPMMLISSYANRFPQGGVNPEDYRDLCWEAVGRIAHLIEDQGVPAHTHFDTHVPFVGDEDYYERIYMSNQAHHLDLTSEKALLKGGCLDLTGKQDPLRYALYLTNQVADRFPSNDADANIEIDTTHPDNYGEILDPIYDNIKVPLVKFNTNPPPGLMEEIAENAGIFSIRATAGFLYWVFQQFQIQPNIPTDIVINNQTIPNTRTYIASNSITTQNAVNITATSNVTLKAGNFIRLTNGTSIKAGSNFYAKLEEIQGLSMIYREQSETYARANEEKANDVASKDLLEAFIPKQYLLFQNYPNPFNPETTIQFDIPKTSNVKISVFDITGREISNFINSELNPGRYQYKFNASSLASGIYFYKIEAGSFVTVKKMSVIK